MSGIHSPRPGAPGARHTRKRTPAAQALGNAVPKQRAQTSAEPMRGRTHATARAAEAESTASGAAQGEALSPMTDISPEQWRVMVAEAAYYRAQQRGFRGGSPEQDWFEAEEEIRRSLEER